MSSAISTSSTSSDIPSSQDKGSITPGRRSARSKYCRPCDACSLRKVKCDQKRPCSRCVKHNLPCTNNRTRKKCGPKHIHEKTRASIHRLIGSAMQEAGTAAIAKTSLPPGVPVNSYPSGNPGNSYPSMTPMITIDKLLPCLQVYQTWYYWAWPVISVAHLISKIIGNNQNSSCPVSLNVDTVSAYSLSCAISAAIRVGATLSSTNPHLINLPQDINELDFVNESLRSRNLFDYRLNPSPETLLTSFFLYIYYTNVKDGTCAAIVYLREAISIAQILGLHDVNTYYDKSPAEVHRLRKIYYMLLVTERFMCIEDKVPVILEPNIPFPSLGDEEYSTLLSGFTELVKIFAIPDKKFFDRMQTNNQSANFKIIRNFLQSSNQPPSQKWIVNIQNELTNIRILSQTPDNQKLNILLSLYWMKTLAWHISKMNNLLIRDLRDENNCLSLKFPIRIAKEFLASTQDLPIFAFESNGRGVCIKLLEIANGLVDTISLPNFEDGFDVLNSIFRLVSKLKNDITLPIHSYKKIEAIVNNMSIINMPTGYITEINDDEQNSKPETSQEHISNVSPFTQMTMAFCLSPNNLSSNNFESCLGMGNLLNDNEATNIKENSYDSISSGSSIESPETKINIDENFIHSSYNFN